MLKFESHCAGQNPQGLQGHAGAVEHVLDEFLVQPLQLRVPVWGHLGWLAPAGVLQGVSRGAQCRYENDVYSFLKTTK